MGKEYWRRFEAWATVFANKFHNNLYLKAQITLTLFLIAVSLLTVGVLALIAYLVANDTFFTIYDAWGALLTEIPSPAFTIQNVINEITTSAIRNVVVIGLASIAAIMVLGVIASRLALNPTREAINAQRNFIAHTAHELRTPLSIARTNIEATLLMEDSVTKEECIKELQRAVIELDTLAGIINNLVTLNTLMNLEPAEYHHYDLVPLIREVIEGFEEFATRKNITVVFEGEPDQIVWGNRNALKQMIANVIGNAISYTNEGGTVRVRVFHLSPRYIRLTVADTGIGIAKEDLAYIFKPFYRTATAKERSDGGSGLGLSIVRELVRLHLGRISIQSEVGEGTTLTIDLPILHRRTPKATLDYGNKIEFNFGGKRNRHDL